MSLASQLKERVRIEAPVPTDDGQGGQTIAWEEVATRWAEVRPVGTGSRESASAQQPEAAAGYRVRIRLMDGVDATMRLQWRNRILMIHSVHEHAETLELLVYEEGL